MFAINRRLGAIANGNRERIIVAQVPVTGSVYTTIKDYSEQLA